ncbi:hypothetical protein SAMN05216428_101101 [Nitrosospira sp. Nsp11]|nr:hypothetical protein [Nitrosospira sp. Nsp11]SHL10919.1 hypothetical protein SAMN05216428_101101 [Nitrosospira sp. Nsp11]
MTFRPILKPKVRQLYALAHAIRKRTDKKAVVKAWFERAKALLDAGRK